MGNTSAGPPREVNAAKVKYRAWATLRQGVWEASQFADPDRIREFVEDVLREVESDEP